MASLLVCWLTFFGLAAFLPGLGGEGEDRRQPWIGARFFAGFAVMPILIVTAQLALHIALVPAAHAVAILAVCGLLLHASRFSAARIKIELFHPIFLLPLAALLAAAARGGIVYEPLAWDELSNWLGWMRQAIMDGYVNSPALSAPATNPVLGYTPGWPIILAFPNLLLGGIDESRSVAIFFLIHAAMLGLVYDVLTAGLARAGWTVGTAALGAWAALLAALAVEATWKLVPTNLLIEEPQTYCLVACFFLALAGTDRQTNPARVGLHVGLAFAAGYLIKLSMLAFAAPLLSLWGAVVLTKRPDEDAGRWPRALAATLIMGLPIVLVYGMWTLLGTPAMCLSSPLGVLRGLIGGGTPIDHMRYVWNRFSDAETAYVLHYKFPLTVLAAVGLGLFTGLRRQWVAPACIGLYLALYFGALYAFHLDCLGEHYLTVMDSTDRYTRVPLRFIQFCGLMLPVLALAPWGRRLASSPGGRIALGAVVAILAGWQIFQIRASLAGIATRADATPQQVDTVRTVRAESRAVGGLVADEPGLGAKVLQISQGGDGYEFVIGRYYGIGRYTLEPAWSWGPAPTDAWMQKTTADDMAALVLSASLVWPLRVDGWMTGVLAPLIADPDCRARITGYFLIPEGSGHSLRCIPKRGG